MIEHDLQDAVELPRGAGKIVLENYGKVVRLIKTHIAASEQAVTETDRAAQRHIVPGLRKRFPDDGLVGEEADTRESITFECTHPPWRNWIIARIDGRNNLIAGPGNCALCTGRLH